MASAATSDGLRSAMAVSVASVKTTYAGTLVSLATVTRHVRSASNVASS